MPVPAGMGWFGSDIADWIGGAAETIVNSAGDVLGNIPGADPLYGAMKDLVEGPLRDFANTPVGIVVLRAMSSTFAGSLGWFVGPQLASVAFAVPGLMRGEDFDKAWFDEVKYRAEKSAEIVTGGTSGAVQDYIQQQFADQIDAALKEIYAQFPVDTYLDWTVQEAATKLSEATGIRIREDVAALVLDRWNHTLNFNETLYDYETGDAKSMGRNQVAIAWRSQRLPPSSVFEQLPGQGGVRLPGQFFRAPTESSTPKTLVVVAGLVGVGVVIWFWR